MQWDKDNSGTLDYAEVNKALRKGMSKLRDELEQDETPHEEIQVSSRRDSSLLHHRGAPISTPRVPLLCSRTDILPSPLRVPHSSSAPETAPQSSRRRNGRRRPRSGG